MIDEKVVTMTEKDRCFKSIDKDLAKGIENLIIAHENMRLGYININKAVYFTDEYEDQISDPILYNKTRELAECRSLTQEIQIKVYALKNELKKYNLEMHPLNNLI